MPCAAASASSACCSASWTARQAAVAALSAVHRGAELAVVTDGGQRPQRRDEAVEPRVVERALEPVAEQRAERLALPHAREEPLDEPTRAEERSTASAAESPFRCAR